jgi:hypothetical protein
MSDPTGGDIPDFMSHIRAYDLPPEAVVSRRLRDEVAKLHERAGPDPNTQRTVVLLGLVGYSAEAVFKLEQQIIDLREEVRGNHRERP